MVTSTSLWLYLRTLAWRPGPALRPSAPALPLRPEGEVIWVHADAGTALSSISHLARQMAQARPALRFVVTMPGQTPDISGFPEDSIALACAAERLPDVRAALDRFAPRLVVMCGLSLPPALIHEARARDLPLALVDLHLPAGSRAPWPWTRRMTAALLERFSLILARDAESSKTLERLLRRPVTLDVTGRIEETTEPLPHFEAEREAIADLLRARPVWFASACPETEEDTIIDAHVRAMRHAHRMLLILAPAEPGRGAALADRLTARGLAVALRSREEEPEEDIQIFVVDSLVETGLWYRLAPVTYMGGTLSGVGAGRSPIEPAALGSAILHGPHTAPYPEAYARLADAGATRPVENGDALGKVVIELIAPDKAAILAHNAWAASSGGAEVTERVMQRLFEQIDLGKAQT